MDLLSALLWNLTFGNGSTAGFLPPPLQSASYQKKCSSGRFRSVDLGVPHINMSPTCYPLHHRAAVEKPGGSLTIYAPGQWSAVASTRLAAAIAFPVTYNAKHGTTLDVFVFNGNKKVNIHPTLRSRSKDSVRVPLV